MKSQARVELRFGTYEPKTGTVSRVFSDGGFRVTYDHRPVINGRLQPRTRITYPAASARLFNVIA